MKHIILVFFMVFSICLMAEDTITLANPKTIYGNDIARVEQYRGVLVFTDCTPLSKYEILGEVDYGIISGVIPQYNEIRDGLISRANLANRNQSDGIIISMVSVGMGRATMIKFTNPSEDKYLAKVNSHYGVLVFIDCKPVNHYVYLGRIDNAGGMNPNYETLRDKLINKSKKKYPDLQAIIPYFSTGGKDPADVIKF